jgi:hypothetical protein
LVNRSLSLARQRTSQTWVSHFETLIHLVLRRSPSARSGEMSLRSRCNDTEE